MAENDQIEKLHKIVEKLEQITQRLSRIESPPGPTVVVNLPVEKLEPTIDKVVRRVFALLGEAGGAKG